MLTINRSQTYLLYTKLIIMAMDTSLLHAHLCKIIIYAQMLALNKMLNHVYVFW